MNRRLAATIVGAAFVSAAAGVQAQDAKMAEAKAKELGCLGCHAVSSKKVGPAFKELAQKFPKQGDKLLAALKADKNHADAIKGVSDDDLELVTNWIAGL